LDVDVTRMATGSMLEILSSVIDPSDCFMPVLFQGLEEGAIQHIMDAGYTCGLRQCILFRLDSSHRHAYAAPYRVRGELKRTDQLLYYSHYVRDVGGVSFSGNDAVLLCVPITVRERYGAMRIPDQSVYALYAMKEGGFTCVSIFGESMLNGFYELRRFQERMKGLGSKRFLYTYSPTRSGLISYNGNTAYAPSRNLSPRHFEALASLPGVELTARGRFVHVGYTVLKSWSVGLYDVEDLLTVIADEDPGSPVVSYVAAMLNDSQLTLRVRNMGVIDAYCTTLPTGGGSSQWVEPPGSVLDSEWDGQPEGAGAGAEAGAEAGAGAGAEAEAGAGAGAGAEAGAEDEVECTGESREILDKDLFTGFGVCIVARTVVQQRPWSLMLEALYTRKARVDVGTERKTLTTHVLTTCDDWKESDIQKKITRHVAGGLEHCVAVDVEYFTECIAQNQILSPITYLISPTVHTLPDRRLSSKVAAAVKFAQDCNEASIVRRAAAPPIEAPVLGQAVPATRQLPLHITDKVFKRLLDGLMGTVKEPSTPAPARRK
jgi:hypothetical protein